jgi:hypothetical protein
MWLGVQELQNGRPNRAFLRIVGEHFPLGGVFLPIRNRFTICAHYSSASAGVFLTNSCNSCISELLQLL